MIDNLIVELFDKAKHDRKSFKCGVEELDDYFNRHANQDVKKSLTALHVLVSKEDETKVLGFYTLASSAVMYDNLPDEYTKKLPKYPIPVVKIGRLALAKEMQGRQLGDLLLANIEIRVKSISEEIGIWALTVDAKSDALADWYEHYGFTRLPDEPLKLFMKI